MNDTLKTLWDPFHGEMPEQRDTIAKPVARLKLPAFIKSILFLIAIFAIGACVYFAVVENTQPALVCAFVFMITISLIFLLDWLAKTKQYHNWLFSQIAVKNDWSFKLMKRPVRKHKKNSTDERIDSAVDAGATAVDALSKMNFSRENMEKLAQSASQTERRSSTLERDELLTPVYERLSVLLSPSLAQPIPFEISAMFWSESQKGFPFWLGVAIGETDMSMAAKSLKTDARGNTNAQGHMFQIIAAYKLDRETHIDAWLMGEILSRDSGRDINTESSEFNDLYKVSIRQTSQKQEAEGELELLRVLTPATQATLIDLRRRYKTQMVLENDTLFISGYDLINVDDIEAVAEIAHQAAEEFAEAALSFKHYAE